MADDVPVTDILCEAMEYLSKLGANLRKRSENLKEKKIRKDRLKNSHAVQKAAQKVLTICELSKKSLDNVEIGVKRILSVVSAAQASTSYGGKTVKHSRIVSRPTHGSADKTSSDCRKIEKDLSSPKSIRVSGKKYILRFPRKVNVKHYQSVKVLTGSIPKSMLDKYPVYYDCKLYRARKRKALRKSNDNRSSVEFEGTQESEETDRRGSQHSITECKETVTDIIKDHNKSSESEDEKEVENKNKKSANELSKADSSDKTQNSNEGKMLEKHEKKQQTNGSSDADSSDKKRQKKSDTKDKILKEKERKKSETEEKISKSNKNNIDSSSSTEEASLKHKNKKKLKRIIIDSSDSDQDIDKKLGKGNEEISNVLSGKEVTNPVEKNGETSKEISSNECRKDKHESEEESLIDKSSNEKPSDASSEDRSRRESKEIPRKESSENESSAEVCKEKIAENEDTSLNSDHDKKSTAANKNQDIEPVKPMIKCVSLTKLLKPDILQKEEKTKTIIVHMNQKGELKSKYIELGKKFEVREKIKSNQKKSVKKLSFEDEKYVAEKKKQLAEFKAKNFDIKVIKLPTLSVKFLHENNLQRITQSGSIVCEISADTLNNKSNSVKRISTSRDINDALQSTDTNSTNEAKNALLNDSDGEKSETSPKKTKRTDEVPLSEDITEKIKNSLLNDSESDKNDEDITEKTSEPSSKTTEDNPTKLQQVDSNPSESLLAIAESSSKDTEETHLKRQGEKLMTTETDKTLANDEQDKELAKSLLLNDSSGSSSKSPDKKRKKDNSGIKSRRKHIMESMHAKKMLLTYSSSSDTEDEQLKNAIKNIKDTLIKNIENEDEAKKSLKKRLLSSSESDEDIVKNIKKKKNISSKSPSPEVVAHDDEDRSDKAEKDEENASDRVSEKSNSSCRKMGRSREKPGGSSNQNSDSLDDKDIEGLTNLKSLSKHRRRRDSDSDKAVSTSTRASAASTKKQNMSKLKHIAGEEGLLEAPESSDEASAAESEGTEDLPPISLPGLNGDGVDHLAKDDLLEESESDSSKEKSLDDKKETDSDSDNLKARRRKANTISSDSEVGSSRRKEKGVKISDFEDSEEESSEVGKRSKRKKGSDSDESAGSSNDGGKKKRRRIKTLDSDASDGSDSENEGKSKHGRKNIRKVMGKNQLEEATKKAAREEKERVARIAERQKMYNNLVFDESGKPDEVILDKVVLDFDPSTKEPLIEVDRGLVKKLKPHQANGIKFMWDACFESVKRIKKDRGSGCILAHCMGLGKTLQVVSLTHTLLTHSDLTHVNRVLVVCPLSTVLNWVNEFKMWLKYAEKDYEVDVYELSKFKQNSERAFQLSSWFKHGGVCVLGYEMFRNLSADNPKKFKKKMLKQFQESLVDPGPDLVVCDEGHLLKNEKTSLSQSMNRVKTQRRIVLTGTPLQNNLKEYYCMVQFVKPNLLGKYNEYLNRFVNPITNGQYTDSTEHDIKIMKRRSHVLHNMLEGAVQRRDYGVLAPFLPPKHEYVLFITLTDVQVKLYQHYLDNYSRRPLPGKSSGFLFPDFQSLQRIWTHPLVLKYNSERYEIMQQKKREREEEEDSEGSLADFIDDESTPDETSSDDESGSLSDASDDSRKKSKKKKSSKKNKKDDKAGSRRTTRANPVEMDVVEPELMEPDPDVTEVKNDNPTEWWIPLVTDDEIEDMRNSNKLVLLFEILRQCEAIGDKLLVFSQSLYSLDLIEHFLGKIDEATQEGRIDEKLGGHVGSWSPGIDYFRLDGSTSCENRSIWCKNFNREDNPRARLFLISTRAGGLGINLVAANRVVIFDVSWNPSHDVQSIFRVFRFGQKKPCYIYRFLAMGTMEEKIYERQVTKQAISKRVIDEQQIDRHYAENDLAELYKFEPRAPEPRPVPLVPKDRLFAEMLKEREHVIYKFHEHDSLLENKEEETLSEEERKAAWEDFENEKNRPPPQPFPSWPMHNGMGQMSNLLAAQQQQLAYAALAQMLRKDMPNLTDDNIRSMLPLIYSSNPGMFGGYDYGLMQKLSSMYAPPGMMNPAMMNPGMNVGGAGGLGGGGSSGLQYEPPWQRQQQQMRMQQLMQQQNQMGAKLYAGGLGSRDPVAMALQQQRAREIMLGGAAGGAGGAGRPRGRPPLQPRAPTAPGDVVNLDSD